MTDTDPAILNLFHVPAILLTNDRVSFANSAARALLGSHIVGQDIRMAIRVPEAVAIISARNGGRVKVSGLSVSGSIWEIACHVLDGGIKLITLDDLSVQVSVARAHADFVANASHELRTPLAAIIGYVETLREPKAGEDPEIRERFLSIIKREAERMQALVEDLMSLSRIEAGKHEEPKDRVDMVALVREAAGEDGGVRTTDVETEAKEAIVAGDRGQMAQVLRNLIDNAHKYGKPGAAVKVTLEVSGTGWVSIAVRDQGEGIPPEHLPRLTERFYRADASRSREAGGTGLGLSIVKHVVERHRGRFDISSRQGRGTVASMMIPVYKG
jgi:two-component system, OmpR family, phosphate regulon sensor histidine kinase PhoR